MLFFKKQLPYVETTLACLGYWLTVLLTRTIIFLSLQRGRTPAIFLRGFHVHHFITGYILLLVALFLGRRHKSPKTIALLLGISLGLVFDEFLYWTQMRFDYWSTANLIAIGVSGLAITLLYFEARVNAAKAKSIPSSFIKHQNPSHPKISVVIPALNEAQFLPATLACMVSQTYSNFELIVVDDNSSDQTSSIAKSFGAKIITDKTVNVTDARQKGFAVARGEIITTTDADTHVPPDWLEQIHREFALDSELVGLGGWYQLYSGPITARLLYPPIAYISWLLEKHISRRWHLPGLNMAIRKEAFLKTHGLELKTKISDNPHFIKQLKKFGTVRLDPTLVVSTSGRRYRNGLLLELGNRIWKSLTRRLTNEHLMPQKNTSRQEYPSWVSVLFPALLVILFLFSLFSEQRENITALLQPPQIHAAPIITEHKEQKIIYLTFDADMTAKMEKELSDKTVTSWYDPELINYLQQNNIPATFFITGMFAQVYPDQVRAWSKNDLFTIGNHTYDHAAFRSPCYKLPVLSSDTAKNTEINKTQTILTTLTGKTPTLFRFPGLCHTPHDLQLVEAAGLKNIDGNLISGDAFNKNVQKIVRTILSQAKDGSIVVMHMGGPNAPAITNAIEQIIPQLQARGFEFKKL